MFELSKEQERMVAGGEGEGESEGGDSLLTKALKVVKPLAPAYEIATTVRDAIMERQDRDLAEQRRIQEEAYRAAIDAAREKAEAERLERASDEAILRELERRQNKGSEDGGGGGGGGGRDNAYDSAGDEEFETNDNVNEED